MRISALGKRAEKAGHREKKKIGMGTHEGKKGKMMNTIACSKRKEDRMDATSLFN